MDHNLCVGLRRYTCRVCGTTSEVKIYRAREMMQGRRDVFEYFACSNCDCMQIAAVPQDLAVYYGDDYYSYAVPENTNVCDINTQPKLEYILDVGCGAGDWLSDWAQKGYKHLFGCDPFIQADIVYPNGVNIRKASIHEMEGEFDLIRFSDSFEHMPDPLEVLLSVKRLLKKDGLCWISIPVYPNIAFDMFGTHWYQLDAPRHLFLHSIKSMKILAQQSGLLIKKIDFDSNNGQFIRSKMYQLDIPYNEQTPEKYCEYLTASEVDQYNLDAAIANRSLIGDHAIFCLALDDQPETGVDDESKQLVELSATMIEALEYLIERTGEDAEDNHRFILQDMLAAQQLIKEKLLAKL